VVVVAYDSTLNNFVDMTQAKAKPYNPRGPQRSSKEFRAVLARVIPSYYQDSGNVFHIKHEVKKFQYAQVSSAGTTTMITVNPGSEHIQVDRGMTFLIFIINSKTNAVNKICFLQPLSKCLVATAKLT